MEKPIAMNVLASLLAAFGLCISMAAAAPATSPPMPPWRTTVREFAASQFNHPAWGYSHSLRDYALARELAAADHVTLDDEVLFAAACLDGMGALFTRGEA